MITVTISINGKTIYCRTAVNTGEKINSVDGKFTIYDVDTGEQINHIRDEGAVVLAKKMLDTIKG